MIKTADTLTGWDRTIFVCVQHVLPTTVSLLNSLVRVGTKPDNIYLLGKPYSTHQASEQQIVKLGIQKQVNSVQTKLGRFSETFSNDVTRMWDYVLDDLSHKKIDAIIILDDGGHCIASTPAIIIERYLIIGIEQTTSGLRNLKTLNLEFPIIDVASSAAKKWLEPIIISKYIIKKSEVSHVKKKKIDCGVIGFGAIGKAVAHALSLSGHNVTIYDKLPRNIIKNNKYFQSNTLSSLISTSDYVFGCTGQDITSEIDICALAHDDKSLISCSSDDTEFKSLLRFIQKTRMRNFPVSSPLDDIFYKTGHKSIIRIFRGGFPINFDNSKKIEHTQGIQLTRGLIFSGILQAMSLLTSSKRKSSAIVALDPVMQQFIARIWGRYQIKDYRLRELLSYFEDINWIRNHSGDTTQHFIADERKFSTSFIS